MKIFSEFVIPIRGGVRSVMPKLRMHWPDGEGLPIAAALVIALTPTCFALATWQEVYVSNSFRIYAVPVLIAELIVFGIAAILMMRTRQWDVKPSPLMVCTISALVLLSVLNARFVAPQPFPAAARAATDIVHCLFALGVFFLASSTCSFSRRFVGSLALGLNLFEIIVFVLLFTHADLSQLALEKVGAGVTNVRQLGFYGSIGVTLALGLSLFALTRRETCIWVFSALLSLAFIIWSGTRGGLYALAGMALVSFFLLPGSKTAWVLVRRLVILTPPAALVSLIWVPDHRAWGLKRILGNFIDQLSENGDLTSGRIKFWTDAIDIFYRRPLTGFGEGQFRFLAPAANGYFAHPHNFILQFLVNWGAIGLCLTGIAIVAGFRNGMIATRASDPVATPALLAATTLLVYGLIDGALYHIYPLSAFLVLLVVASTRSRLVDGTRTANTNLH